MPVEFLASEEGAFKDPKMIKPYNAVALQTNVLRVPNRKEVYKNLDHIGNMIDLVHHMCGLELPVKLIALGEIGLDFFVKDNDPAAQQNIFEIYFG